MAKKDQPPTPPGEPAAEEHEVSLDELSAAFAEAMRGEKPQTHKPAASPGGEAAPDEVSHGLEETEGAEPPEELTAEVTPCGILEAMLFTGSPDNTPLTAERAASLMRGVDAKEIHELVKQLNARYESAECPYHIVSEGAGYRLRLREEFARLREKFYGRVRQARLSQAAIDVLALVAYNQPIDQEEVNKLRSAHSNSILLQLVRRQLLRVDRTDEKPSRKLYHTTGRFLALLGLESLKDLPQSHDLEPQ